MAVRINPFFSAVLICIFIFYSGFFSFPKQKSALFIFPQESISQVGGQITSSPVKSSSGKYYSSTFRLKAAGRKDKAFSSAHGTITLYIPTQIVEALYPGSLYSDLQSEHIFETGLYGLFKGRYQNNAFYVESVEASYWKDSFLGKIERSRAIFRLTFKRMMYSWKGAGGLLLALLCGSREFTERVTSEAFKKAGLSHILALSGMHLSLFSTLALFIGKKTKSKRLATLLRLGIISTFCWFAGFSPSLLRAFLCSLLSIIAASAGLGELKTRDILCAAFLIQVSVCPEHIYNAGFLFSYGALAGITFFSSLIHFLLVRFTPQVLSSSLSASISAQIFTAPIALKIFGTFYPIGIIATMVVSPLVTLFIYSGLILILLSMIIPILQMPSGIFMNFLYTIIKSLVLFFSKLD